MVGKAKITKWNAGKILGKTKDQIEENMGVVVQMLRGDVIKSINTSQETVTSRTGRRRGLNPSTPGQPPKRVEGDLVRSIVAEVKVAGLRIVGRYGSTQTKKAIGLEFGTSRGLAARPFLRPPLARRRKEIVRILAK